MKRLPALLLAAATATSAWAAANRTATLAVDNMESAVCPIVVRKALEKVPGVASAQVDLKSKRAVVAFDPAQTTPEALTKATSDAGFPSIVKQLQ